MASKSWLGDDITFCMNNTCTNKKCYRHCSNIRVKDTMHSFAMFEGTQYCPLQTASDKNEVEK